MKLKVTLSSSPSLHER